MFSYSRLTYRSWKVIHFSWGITILVIRFYHFLKLPSISEGSFLPCTSIPALFTYSAFQMLHSLSGLVVIVSGYRSSGPRFDSRAQPGFLSSNRSGTEFTQPYDN